MSADSPRRAPDEPPPVDYVSAVERLSAEKHRRRSGERPLHECEPDWSTGQTRGADWPALWLILLVLAAALAGWVLGAWS